MVAAGDAAEREEVEVRRGRVCPALFWLRLLSGDSYETSTGSSRGGIAASDVDATQGGAISGEISSEGTPSDV